MCAEFLTIGILIKNVFIILHWISQSLRNMHAEFLTIGSLIIYNPTPDFPKPEKYVCRIPNYSKFHYL